jgi:RNA polymerase sigma factor (sigma-70 family)
VRGDLTVEEAFRKWADELTRYATALVGPADASDLVAETFATIVARGAAAWQSLREPRNYLYRSVTNAASMSARSRSRRHQRELRWLAEPPHTELLIDPSVRSALNALSVQQRAVIVLTYWLDLAPATVAEMLGVSEGSVKRQLARARSTLREVLQ